MPWAPVTLSSAIPAGAEYFDAPVSVLASLNDFAGNFGHALFDFMYPVFNIMQMVNSYTSDFQLLLADHQVGIASAFNLPSTAEHRIRHPEQHFRRFLWRQSCKGLQAVGCIGAAGKTCRDC